jgi:hypothetical protein
VDRLASFSGSRLFINQGVMMGAFTKGDLFERELRKLIDGDIERLKEQLSFGLLKSHEEYLAITGRIAGLRACLSHMEEAESIVRKTIG